MKPNIDTPGGLAPEHPPGLLQISENLYRWSDTCHVYLLNNGSQAVLIDFGDGSVLQESVKLGVNQVIDILMTQDTSRAYQAEVRGGETLELEVEMQVHRPGAEMAFLKVLAPAGWHCEEERIIVNLDPVGTRNLKFRVTPPAGTKIHRARVAIDLTIGNRRYGQQAVALVSVS